MTEVKINRQEVRLKMFKQAKLDPSGIPELVASQKGNLKFMMTEEPYFLYTERKKQKDCMAMLEKAKELLLSIGKLAEDAKNTNDIKEQDSENTNENTNEKANQSTNQNTN